MKWFHQKMAMNYKIVSTQLLTLAFCTALHFAIVVRTFSFFKLIDLYILSQKPNLSKNTKFIINFTSKLLIFFIFETISSNQNDWAFHWSLLAISIFYCCTEAELKNIVISVTYCKKALVKLLIYSLFIERPGLRPTTIQRKNWKENAS